MAKDRDFGTLVLPALCRTQRDGEAKQGEGKHTDGKADKDHGTVRIRRLIVTSGRMAVRAQAIVS
ncbi:MAG: hypothetical protein WAL49_03435, partial [Pseudolabrys sp.]